MTWCYATNGNESSSCGNCELFKSIPDLVRLSTIRLSGVVGLCSLIFLLISVLSGTAEENLRLQPAAQPGHEAERLHGVPPTRLGLQSVLWQGEQTGNLCQAPFSTRHPHRIQPSGVWFPSLDPPEPGLWQEGSAHQPPTVLPSVNIAGFRRER